jgi:hypothetical protein
MKMRVIIIAIVLAMVAIAFLNGKNRALQDLLDDCKSKDIDHVDLIFDLQQENSRLLEVTYSLETENAILGSCCANEGLYPDEINE